MLGSTKDGPPTDLSALRTFFRSQDILANTFQTQSSRCSLCTYTEKCLRRMEFALLFCALALPFKQIKPNEGLPLAAKRSVIV